MKIIAYFAFTLLSIVIQFCVMDFIQGNIQMNGNTTDLKVTSQKKRFSDIMKDFKEKPHALYYRTQVVKQIVKNDISAPKKYINMTLLETVMETSELPVTTTLIDLLYDENTSVTEDIYTTESFLTTTEIDNVTEITLFANNNTISKTPTSQKRIVTKDCACNLLYNVCDINCCCDSDCIDSERNIFDKCVNDALEIDKIENFCISHDTFYSKKGDEDSLFCIAKTNLPEKRKLNRIHKHDSEVIKEHFKWHSNSRQQPSYVFKRQPYESGDPIWILRNGSISYMDLPTPLVNNYCQARKRMTLLQEEKVECLVKLKDLEVFQMLSILQDAPIVSISETSKNSTTWNCTTLHCTNWTVIVCDDSTCETYNKTLHDSFCTEDICTNIALKLVYIFYYHDSKIVNATIKLHTQKLSLKIPVISQEIKVKFFLANVSDDKILDLSGNPGYLSGLPVIVSYVGSNHTEKFFNTSRKNRHLAYPKNENGLCVLSNTTNNFVLFGLNKRVQCRYVHKVGASSFANHTQMCGNIQKGIHRLLGLNRNVYVSPLGNPREIRDEEWLQLLPNNYEAEVYGEIDKEKTKVSCFNLVSRISLIMTYADVSETIHKEKFKLLSVNMDVSSRNTSFILEDISTLVTVDIQFIDETKQSAFEFAGGPQLNIHLPKDFFFPFPSKNRCDSFKCNMMLIVYMFLSLLFIK